MSVALDFNNYDEIPELNIREAKDLVISARAVNEQNRITAENTVKSLKQVAARITPEIVAAFMERGIDVEGLVNPDWELLISSEQYRNDFVKTHRQVLAQLVNHIKAELGQL